MRRRAAITFLGLALAACGTDGAEPPAPVSLEAAPDPEETGRAATPAGETPSGGAPSRQLDIGAYAADSTLCSDSSEALHALMPEAFEEGEPAGE